MSTHVEHLSARDLQIQVIAANDDPDAAETLNLDPDTIGLCLSDWDGVAVVQVTGTQDLQRIARQITEELKRHGITI